MKELPGRREYLGTFLGSYVPPKDGQHLPQGLFGEANSNNSIPGLRFAHDQANNLVFRKAEIRTAKKTRYKVR